MPFFLPSTVRGARLLLLLLAAADASRISVSAVHPRTTGRSRVLRRLDLYDAPPVFLALGPSSQLKSGGVVVHRHWDIFSVAGSQRFSLYLV